MWFICGVLTTVLIFVILATFSALCEFVKLKETFYEELRRYFYNELNLPVTEAEKKFQNMKDIVNTKVLDKTRGKKS